MSRDPRHDVLFEPLAIGPKTLRNRFYQVPHASGFGIDKPHSQAGYRAMKAEGGWAAVCVEMTAIDVSSDLEPIKLPTIWDDDDIRALQLTTRRVHEHDALAGVELSHAVAFAHGSFSRMPPRGPSGISAGVENGVLLVPQVMSVAEIRRMSLSWAEAASRARDAGFDIVYVYGGHTFGPMQFLSPYFNKRDDSYGGSLANRARFWVETLEAVREAVGGDCAIATRISVDAISEQTVDIEDALEFVRIADELVDLWDVNISSIIEWSKDSGSARFFPEGYQLEWTGRVREATAKPIVGVSRLTDPDRMAEIVRSGAWDVIGAARPSIADPFLPTKIAEGRLDDVRECVGHNHCIAKAMKLGQIGCMQNATAGEEFRRGWHPERFDRAANADLDVLVVGAGPAGMECAIVLGRRGMSRVHLVDAADELGGTLRWMPRLPGLGQWARLLNHRTIQMSKLRNVEFVPRTRLDAHAVREYGAELFVIATGSRWSPIGVSWIDHEGVAGADASAAHVLTPEQLMLEGKRPPGARVVVYDCEGDVIGTGLAELLRAEGHEVDLVTPMAMVAECMEARLEGELVREHLHGLGIGQRPATIVTEIAPGRLDAVDAWGEPLELEADAIVLVTQREPDDALYRELVGDPDGLTENGIVGVYRAGDCVAPVPTPDAIYDGHRLAREIDSDDPQTPLVPRREGWPDYAQALVSARSALHAG